MGRMIAIGSRRVRALLAPGASLWLLGLWLVAVGGCGRPQAQFSTNQVYLRYQDGRPEPNLTRNRFRIS